MVTTSSIVENIIIVIISAPWTLTRISHLILSVAIRSGEATPHLEMGKRGLEKLSYPESLPISRGAEIDHAHLWLIPLDISPCHCSPVAELGWLLARPHCCSRVTMGTGTKYHQSSGLLFPLATLTPKQFWAHSMMIKYWHNRTLCWLLWPKHASKH